MSEIDERGLKAALEHYSEGGCMGLSDHEKREVVEAIIRAYEAARADHLTTPYGALALELAELLKPEAVVAGTQVVPVHTQTMKKIVHFLGSAHLMTTYASPQPADVVEEARFLLARLDEFERDHVGHDRTAERDFAGHVSPSISRLRKLVEPRP